MNKLRKYRAFWDDGHDFGEFEYYSKYRNFSKKNMEDLKNTFLKKYGISRYKKIKKFQFGYIVKEVY